MSRHIEVWADWRTVRRSKLNAETFLAEIRSTVRTWRDHAQYLAIPRHEQEIMASAFGS